MTARDYAFILLIVTPWGLSGLIATLEVRKDTQETLRLLKRGDKVDCRMSEMKGTLP